MVRSAAVLVGNWIGSAVVALLLVRLIEATSEPSPMRDQIVLLMWPLVVIGSTIIALALVLRNPQPAPHVPGQRNVTSAPRVQGRLAPPKETERQFVHVSPAYLVALFDTHTTREAKQLIADFIGKWMPVRGVVRDVSEFPEELFVQIRDEVPDARLVSLAFRGKWMERAATLRRGQLIEAIGQINRVDGISLALDPTEFPPDSQSSNEAIP